MRKILGLIFAGLSILFFQNCSNTGSQFIDSSVTSLNSCNPDLSSVSHPTKILFLVDTSGSNETSKKQIGSDDGKKWRLSVLNSFLNQSSQNPYVYFSLSSFQNSSTTSLINVSGQAAFSDDSSVFSNGIAAFSQIDDDGDTPYQAAFQAAKSIINRDLKSTSGASYVIVMMTDGEPSDYQTSQGETDNSAILQDVKSLVALAPGQITFNTIYYFNENSQVNQTAYTRLQNMATAGGGLAQIADTTMDSNIYQNIQLPSQSCL